MEKFKKNGGKLDKTSYLSKNYKRSPKTERVLPQLLLLLLLQGQENKKRLRVLQPKLRQLLLLQRQLNQKPVGIKVRVEKPRENETSLTAEKASTAQWSKTERTTRKLLQLHLPVYPAESADISKPTAEKAERTPGKFYQSVSFSCC